MKARADVVRVGVALATLAVCFRLVSAPSPTRESGPRSFRVTSVVPGGGEGIELSGTDAVPQLTAAIVRGLTNGYPLRAGDELRTPRPSLTLLKQQLSVLNLEAESVLTVLDSDEAPALRLESGRLWFESRGQTHTLTLHTPYGVARFTGTKFHLEVGREDSESARLLMIDGEAVLESGGSRTHLVRGEEGEMRRGQEPTRSKAKVDAWNQAIRWVLYYPGVLHLPELAWPAGGPPVELEGALAAYQSGDLLGALEQYPTDRAPVSSAEKAFRAATLLAVGDVDGAAAVLGGAAGSPTRLDAATEPLGEALRLVMNTVQNLACDRHEPDTASGWLAESYHQQSRTGPWKGTEEWETTAYRKAGERDNIGRALIAASEALRRAQDFGFAAVRVAELEFSQGRAREAKARLEEALERRCPRHAQGWALRGFVTAAAGRRDEARTYFARAIELDPGLANGWLGRGLLAIGGRDLPEGLDDLQTAAAQEPDSASLRSYLGKAYHVAGEEARARAELGLAGELDGNDPTPGLYSALINRDRNRINEAIDDLERSKQLNDHRQLFRSRALLDQDRAVRGANLAGLYRDAGMTDVSMREAVRAVTSDYGNASAHLFLAGSYDARRDPGQINLRYETPWLNELLIAQLLQPVGAGSLSQTVTQQEYSRLFAGDRLGWFSLTEYQSNGDWRQSASQHGVTGNSAYSADVFYTRRNGPRVNDDYEELNIVGKVQQQFTPDDTVLVQAGYLDRQAGDTRQHYDATNALTQFRVQENQEPILLVGYRHHWSPGQDTLFLGGWLNDTVEATDSSSNAWNDGFLHEGTNSLPLSYLRALSYRSELNLGTAELQHLATLGRSTIIAGVRYQGGEIRTSSVETDPRIVAYGLTTTNRNLDDTQLDSPLNRFSAYAYEYGELWPQVLTVVAGVTYDRIQYPVNHRSSPISAVRDTRDQVSPKAGLILTPGRETSLRAAYTRSLGGLSLDQSFRLEPTQVAGFVQDYRSLAPESVVGSVPVPRSETAGVLLDHRFRTRTYVAVGADWVWSEAAQQIGTYRFLYQNNQATDPVADSIGKDLRFREESVAVSVNQLLGKYWSLGLRYRAAHTELETGTVHEWLEPGTTETSALLHALDGYVLVNLPCGFFADFRALWRHQSNTGYTDLPGNDFAQFNAFAGYRFLRRRGELRLGVLNLTDQDYRLNPLSYQLELPRERTFYAALKLDF